MLTWGYVWYSCFCAQLSLHSAWRWKAELRLKFSPFESAVIQDHKIFVFHPMIKEWLFQSETCWCQALKTGRQRKWRKKPRADSIKDTNQCENHKWKGVIIEMEDSSPARWPLLVGRVKRMMAITNWIYTSAGRAKYFEQVPLCSLLACATFYSPTGKMCKHHAHEMKCTYAILLSLISKSTMLQWVETEVLSSLQSAARKFQ